MKLESLEQLFRFEIADLQDTEEQLTKALPKMAEAASSPELRQAFQDHLEQTQTHAERLERIVNRMSESPPSKTCQAIRGLIKEGSEVVKAGGDPAVKDAALIAAAQRVEHYEIAAYGCARTFAELLGDTQSAQMLQQTLNEEAETDRSLTQLAKGLINVEAASA